MTDPILTSQDLSEHSHMQGINYIYYIYYMRHTRPLLYATVRDDKDPKLDLIRMRRPCS